MKQWRRRLRAQVLGALFALAGLLSLSFALALGAWLGGLAFGVLRGERHKALRHLAIAFPEKSHAERRRLGRESFAQLGRSALELAQFRKLDLATYVDWPAEQISLVRAALSQGRGGTLVFGHLGNWELVGPRFVAAGFGGVAIGRESGDPFLAKRIAAARRALGVPVVPRGTDGTASAGGQAVREILRALKAGKFVAVLLDQDTRVDSVFVPFFGRLAHTPRAAEDLVRLSRGCCVLAFIHRKPGGGHLLTTEVVDAAAPELTARLTRRIEAELRAYPSEWVWMHERWKRRPPEPSEGSAPTP